MSRLAILSAVLFGGILSSEAVAQHDEPVKPATAERLTVRVIDTRGRGVPGVEVKVVEEDATPPGDGSGPRTAAYRTGADGRVQIAIDPRFHRLTFEARPDDRTIGWASLRANQAWPKANEADPITLTLLSRNHQVDGTVVDTRGKPIRGVQVRAVQFYHDANEIATDDPPGDERPSLASAVTDETGRYRLSLPEGTTVILCAYHPWFVGETFHCKSDSRTIVPARMEEAGGIVGTVVDAATGRPVMGAEVHADRIEHGGRILNGNGEGAVSDAQGRFRVGGLALGVYNVLFGGSPKGRRFTARAVEGVRVKAREDARAHLRIIEGRRLRGMAVVAETGEPLVCTPIFCHSASHPRSGAACQRTYTDEQGCFEHFVPPGPALVYIALPCLLDEHRKTLNVVNDHDPDPVILKRTTTPNAKAFQDRARLPECEVVVRVKADAGGGPAPGEERALSGRVFDKDGSPLTGVLVYYSSVNLIEGATDRLGLFRLKGLPHGRVRLGVRWNGDEHSSAIVPAEAVEVDLIVPDPRDRAE